MSDPVEEALAHHPEQEEAELLRRTAEVAGVVAATEEKIAATLEQVAQHRSPPDAERLRAMARDAREYAVKERDRAARCRIRGGDDGQAGEPRREPRPPGAGSAGNEPEYRESRREQIGQRVDAIRTRLNELREKREGTASLAISGERLASAQHHAAASQAAAEQATGANAQAARRTADSHERAALQHERAAAAGSGDKDKHEQQAAIHRAAAVTDTQRAEDAQITVTLGPPAEK